MSRNHLVVNNANKETSLLKLPQHLNKGHCFVFLHMKTCPYTIPFYDIWDDVKEELSKVKGLTLVEIDSDVIWYIKQNHNDVYQKLTSLYPEEDARKIYFPTFLFFKDGKQHKLMDRVDARIEGKQKEAYEQLLSFAFLYHYRTDDTSKKSATKSTKETSSKSTKTAPKRKSVSAKDSKKSLHHQISQAFNKLLV
jgi:hypothetical protein